MTTTQSDTTPPTFRLACILVGVIAGLTGMVMLIAPDPASTDRYFSWGIKPAPVAALVGGFYLASAVVFTLVAVRDRWSEARALAIGVFGLCLPTLVATAIDTELFDFSRFQAIAWVVLFVGAPIAFAYYLRAAAGRAGAQPGPALPVAGRVAFAVLAVVYAGLAAALVIDPTVFDGVAPFTLARLSGRFVGAWAAFLAVVAAVAALRGRARESLLPALALVLWPLAGVAPALRVPADFAATGRTGYLVFLLVLAALGGAALLTALHTVTGSQTRSAAP